jgi:hypothetical protein
VQRFSTVVVAAVLVMDQRQVSVVMAVVVTAPITALMATRASTVLVAAVVVPDRMGQQLVVVDMAVRVLSL